MRKSLRGLLCVCTSRVTPDPFDAIGRAVTKQKAINFTVTPRMIDTDRKIVTASATFHSGSKPLVYGARVALRTGVDIGWVRELPAFVGIGISTLAAHGVARVWVTLDIFFNRGGPSEASIKRYQRFTGAALVAGYTIEWQVQRPGYTTRADFERCLLGANPIEKPRAYID